MKSPYIADIQKYRTGQPVSRTLFAVDEVGVRIAANGSPFLRFTLADITGSIGAVMFNQGTLPEGIGPGEPVLVSGVFNKDYNNIDVKQVEKYIGNIDLDDFLASSSRNKDEMCGELFEIIATVEEPHLRELLAAIFGDPDISNKFAKWPGAKEVHHAFMGGLLEHTLAVARLCDTSVTLYNVDVRDMTISGALLHDIGKLLELDLKLTVTFTDVGSLLGHSVLGANFVRDRITRITGFPEQLRDQLLHIILSHLGEPEWGAVTRPMTLEALLVHMADNTDAKANRYQTLINQQRALPEHVSSRDYFLGTRVYAPNPGNTQ